MTEEVKKDEAPKKANTKAEAKQPKVEVTGGSKKREPRVEKIDHHSGEFTVTHL